MVSGLGTGDHAKPQAAGAKPQAAWGRARAAFTLLELVLVLLVAAVLLGVALPALRPFAHGREAHQAAGELVAMTRLARSLAVSEGRTYRLHVDRERGELWLSHTELAEDEAVPVPVARPIALPSEVALTWDADDEVLRRGYVRFHPNGRRDAATFVLRGQTGEPVAVTSRSPVEHYAVREVDESESW